MAVSSKSDVEKKLAALQVMFKQQLPDKAAEIECAWEAFCQNTSNETHLIDLHRIVHTLSGSGATFGAVAVSTQAREIEKTIQVFLDLKDTKTSISSECHSQIDRSLKQLIQTAEQWQPSGIPYLKPSEAKEQRTGNLIYLAEDDELLANDLISNLEQANYAVRHFVDLSDFEAACEKEIPAAVIMDMVFSESGTAGADVINRLKAKGIVCPPVIFISVRDDIDAHLSAARAGARRYFSKPLDMNKLIATLDGLTVRTATKPYRVLLIDDDEILLDYNATVLRDAGMEIKTLSRPLEGLKVLTEFQPDVIVLDVYMPGCSGLEMAQVIRQDDAYAQTPIMFLSTETDLNRQLNAIDLGGDDFLVKPVEADHLVSAVIARAKRARWTNRLNKDLNHALRESEFQHIAMNQHDIVSVADVSGRITEINDKFCEISGYSRQELLGSNHRLLKSDYHPTALYEDMWNTITQGSVWHGTICNRKKNGAEYWVDSTIVPFLDDKGKPYKYVSVRTDITNLKVSEERLERSQAYANIGTWDWDIRNNNVYWSDRVKKLYGYTPELKEVTFDHFMDIVHPEDLVAVDNAVKACLEQGVKYDIEHRVIWPDGSVRWMLERGDVIRSEKDELLHMMGVVQDITERKEAEISLRETEERFSFAVGGAGDGIWDWDMNTSVMQFSQFYMEMLGYAENELPHHVDTWVTGVHPDDLEGAQQNLQDYLEGRTAKYVIELRLRCKDDSYKWILCRGTVVERDKEDKPIRMIGIHSDITERVEAELRQQGNNQILEKIVIGASQKEILETIVLHAEKMLDGAICSILLTDSTGKYLKDGVSPSLPDFYNEAVEGIDVGVGVGSCGESAYSGERVVVTDIMSHPNWVSFRDVAEKAGLRACWSEPFFSTSGDVLGTFSIYYSTPRRPEREELEMLVELAQFAAITVERNLSQKALMSAKEEAENANRAKSQFLSSMSHELRTPMNAIMGFGQLLKMGTEQPLDESQQENVDEIVKASHHLMALINEVLDLAKIEAGRIDLSIEAVAVGEVIAESLQLIAPLAKNRGIQIKLILNDVAIEFDQFSEDHAAVRADRTRLKQVLLNLLSNAVKYNSENGTLTIHCNNSDQLDTRISISDSGEGLTQQQQVQLFKAFSRLGAEQSDIEGTGIGLVITKNIVELMGGNIGVNSQPGEGSTFWVELPTDELHTTHPPVNDHATTAEENENMSSETNTVIEHTVLYIEDNPANLRLVTQLLSRRPNIHMWSAPEPLLGLELAAEHKPDLILLDINLPGMSGFEVLKHLRQREGTRSTPVIAISANAMPRDIEKGMEAGFNDYITKPIDVRALLHAVDVTLLDEK